MLRAEPDVACPAASQLHGKILGLVKRDDPTLVSVTLAPYFTCKWQGSPLVFAYQASTPPIVGGQAATATASAHADPVTCVTRNSGGSSMPPRRCVFLSPEETK